MANQSWIYAVIKHPLRWLTRFIAIADEAEAGDASVKDKPIVYVMRSTSRADFSMLQRAAASKSLPDPEQNGKISA